MHRFCLALLLLAGLLPSSVSAQTTTGLTVYYNDELVKNSNNQLILSTKQCDDDISIRFDIRLGTSGGSSGSNPLRNFTEQIWEGPSSCRATGQRQDPNGDDCSQATCTLVDSRNIDNTSELAMTVRAQQLFPDCNPITRTVTLVAVESPSCRMPGEDEFSSEYSAKFVIRGEPDAPTDVEVADGNASLGVSWKRGGNSTNTDRFKLYVDTDPGPNCNNELLQEGMDASEANMLAMMDEVRTFTTSETSRSLSTSSLGLDVGDYAAVYVATIDAQANDLQGKLSAMACGQRILTEGPLGAVEAETGKSIQTCSGGGQHTTAANSAAVLMGLLGLWLVRRRENRA